MVDDAPTDTSLSIPPGMTDVKIIDYDFVRFINFEAEINYPEDEGIVQIENFGMHLNVDGTILYGIKVEAIMDRHADHISLDHLSRLLVDVHQDSSEIMNDLLSGFQRSLLDMIFMGDMANRGKFNMIISENIEPFLPAEEYMDREDNENELKQVLGDLHNAYDLGEDGVLIVGRDGMLVAGANARDYETIIVAYLALLCKEMFIRNFFVRTFILDDLLKKVRTLIMNYQQDPNNISRIRLRLNDGSRDIILLKEILGYLIESLSAFKLPPAPKNDPTGEQLFNLLDLKTLRHDIGLRCTDLEKLVDGAHHELGNLQQMTDVINTKQLEDVFKNVEANTKYLVDASAANERASASLEVMQIILAGSFAFDIVDRVSGGTLNITVPDWVNTYLVDPIISVPLLWFLLNMAWLFFVSVMLMKLMRTLGEKANGALTMRVKVNKKIDIDKLHAFLGSRFIDVTDSVSEKKTDIKKSMWVEEDEKYWKGEPPKIEIQYDEAYAFLLAVIIGVNSRNTELNQKQLIDKFHAVMNKAEVYTNEEDDEDEQGGGEDSSEKDDDAKKND